MAQSKGGKAVSDTPRTDEQINGKPCTRFAILAGDSLRNAAVPSEFARTLERELNATNDRIKRLEEMYEGKIGENEQFLGSNLQGLLTRELNAANERIKRLDETLEDVTDKLDSAWGIYMKFKEAKP
jgi:uncharacterized protein YPO0396